MKTLQEFISKLFSQKSTRHLFFCVIVLLLFLTGIITNSRSFNAVAARGLIVYLFFLACVYSGRWLFKRWIGATRYKQLLISTILYTTVLTFICTVGISLIFHPVRFDFYDFFLISFVLVVLFLFIGISITIIHTTFVQQIQNARIAEQQKQSELNLLQSQLSPHFLFNTLNNMYGLSITAHKRVPRLLLKLSELLRYSVYDTKNAFVLLADEVNYINNYIEFENLRLGERLMLRTDMDCAVNSTIKIAPMLLIVFIENAFNHSKNTADDKIEIAINLHVKENYIWFYIKNTFNSLPIENKIINESSGIGLVNTIKRLKFYILMNIILAKNRKMVFIM